MTDTKLTPAQLLSIMLRLVSERFEGKFDKAGLPYVLHCLKVMHYLKTDDLLLMCIALGHDLIEDTKTTYQELYDLGFPDRVISGIRCMTKDRGETPEQYKKKVMSNMDAVDVKLADLRHNSDIRRLKGVSQKDIERTIKYHEFYLELKELKNAIQRSTA